VKDSVLDKLSEHLNIIFISELKNLKGSDRTRAAQFCKNEKAENYSIASWNDACRYLTGERGWLSAEEAKKSLIEWLEK